MLTHTHTLTHRNSWNKIAQHPSTHTHLPDEVCQSVSLVVDLPVSVQPSVSDADFVPLEDVLIREGVGQVMALQVGHTGTWNYLHGPPT